MMALSRVLVFGLLALAYNAAAVDALASGEAYVEVITSADLSSVTCSIAGDGAANFWQEGVTYSYSNSMSEGKVLVTQYKGKEVNCCIADEADIGLEGVDPCKTTYECPEYFSMFGEYCYSFSLDKAYWNDAQDDCKELHADAHLVRPYTQEIDDFIISQVSTTKNNFWNDINCLENNDRHFQYSNGEDLTYTNWARGEPNNFKCDGDSKCAEDCGMYFKSKDYNWNDAKCHKSLRYVCQMERVPVYSDYEVSP